MKDEFTRMTKKVSTLVALTFAGLIIAFFAWRIIVNQLVLVDREQAIQTAVQESNLRCGMQFVEQPSEFQTELMTYKKIKSSPYKGVQYGLVDVISDRPVWIVTINGRWLFVGGPLPEDPESNAEPYYGSCIMFIDAWTGAPLSQIVE